MTDEKMYIDQKDKQNKKKILFLGQYLRSDLTLYGRSSILKAQPRAVPHKGAPDYSATTAVLSQAAQAVESQLVQAESAHSVQAGSAAGSAAFLSLQHLQEAAESMRATTAKDINTFFIIEKYLVKQNL